MHKGNSKFKGEVLMCHYFNDYWIDPIKHLYNTGLPAAFALDVASSSVDSMTFCMTVTHFSALEELTLKQENIFVNLKSNSALLYNKGHNLLTSAFPPKHVKIIKFPLKGWIFTLIKE